MIESVPGSVADETLWSYVLPVVNDARKQALDWLAEGHDPPRLDLPYLGTFPGGLPHLISGMIEPAEQPRQLSRLFSLFASGSPPFTFSSIPSLRALVTYIRSRQSLLERFTPTIEGERLFDTEEQWQNFIEAMAAILALSVMDRADALGVTDDESKLRAIYSQREMGILAEDLPIELVAPLCCTRFSVSKPLRIASNIRIEPMDNLMHLARSPRWSSIDTIPPAVISAASHAIVIEGIRISNSVPMNRMTGMLSPVSKQYVDDTILGIRVLTDVPVGYAQLFLRPIGWADRWEHNLPPLITYGTYREYPDTFDSHGWLNAQEIDAKTLERLPTVLSSLKKASASVMLAARRLSQTQLRASQDDITIDSCIGLEALLSKDTAELTHRLSLRAAALLASRTEDAWSAHAVYGLVRSVYKHRSAIVHGTNRTTHSRTRIGDRAFETSTLASALLREVLLTVIERPEAATPEALDEMLLSSLDSQGQAE